MKGYRRGAVGQTLPSAYQLSWMNRLVSWRSAMAHGVWGDLMRPLLYSVGRGRLSELSRRDGRAVSSPSVMGNRGTTCNDCRATRRTMGWCWTGQRSVAANTRGHGAEKNRLDTVCGALAGSHFTTDDSRRAPPRSPSEHGQHTALDGAGRVLRLAGRRHRHQGRVSRQYQGSS